MSLLNRRICSVKNIRKNASVKILKKHFGNRKLLLSTPPFDCMYVIYLFINGCFNFSQVLTVFTSAAIKRTTTKKDPSNCLSSSRTHSSWQSVGASFPAIANSESMQLFSVVLSAGVVTTRRRRLCLIRCQTAASATYRALIKWQPVEERDTFKCTPWIMRPSEKLLWPCMLGVLLL